MISDNSQNILSKFTYHFKKVLINAQNLAYSRKADKIGPDDLLVSLLSTKGSLGSDILIKQKINASVLQSRNISHIFPTENIDIEGLPQPSDEAQKIIEKAVVTAYKHEHKYIGTEHLLWGIVSSEDKGLQELLKLANINVHGLKQHLNLVLKSTSKFSDLTTEEEVKELEGFLDESPSQNDGSVLESFTVNLTSEEIQKDIDPVIGRKNEIDRLIEILSRRTKNNPVLLGDAGVGKTAIIEGLAKRITENKVPEVLLNKVILNLDISSLLAGTMYRGEFENRLKQVINEIKNNPNIILFIDELHTIMGAGATTGSLDAANILKPALARGYLRCIGATTFEEYKKHIESDKALERRFQPIIINESSELETLEILRGIRINYEKFHKVEIEDAALETAVTLSKRFLPHKKLPDKAIDLIDEAAARFRVKNTKASLAKKIKETKDKVDVAKNNKQQAILDENYLEALKYKQSEEKYLEELLRLQAQNDKQKVSNLGKINSLHIKEIISDTTGIPLSSLTTNDSKRLMLLEKKLGQNIFGQDEALRTIANTIRRSKAGLHDKNRPLASFIFLGPSGVGKTESAKQIASEIFGGQHNLLRIDMSEFSESFNISKLIGAPAGYVGYKEGNKLTDFVKNKPYSIVLFDEIEKAHPDVFNLLLPILEEGELTDATGRTVNFRNCVIVMTSNIGLEAFNRQASLGFSLDEEENNKTQKDFSAVSKDALANLNRHFPPEFINRLDNIIVFKPLDVAAAKKIIRREIEQLTSRLIEQRVTIKLGPKVINNILKVDASPVSEGARSLKRLVDRHITSPLTTALLTNGGKEFNITWQKDKIVIK